MRFRTFSHKHNLYTNSPFWPCNQRTTSEFVLSPSGGILEIVRQAPYEDENDFVIEHDSRNFSIEPWTGHFDSKGKKIYRGDLLQLDCYKLVYEIDWREDRFVMKPTFEASGEIPDHFRTHKDISSHWSVIGNIHGVDFEDS